MGLFWAMGEYPIIDELGLTVLIYIHTVLSGVYFKSEELFDDMVKPIVVVVCGGNMASLDLFETWKNLLKA